MKMRRSRYVKSTVKGVLTSGLTNYYRKLEIYLEGGPMLKARASGRIGDVVNKRRTKLGAGKEWFSRRRGGGPKRDKKTDGWRNKRSRKNSNPRADKQRRSVIPGESRGETVDLEQPWRKGVVFTLYVPFTIGSKLKVDVQEAEDSFVSLTKADKVRVEARNPPPHQSSWSTV